MLPEGKPAWRGVRAGNLRPPGYAVAPGPDADQAEPDSAAGQALALLALVAGQDVEWIPGDVTAKTPGGGGSSAKLPLTG